jgi:GR25 family glycosyltransferase involved in LPS biosynthesis
MSKAIVLNLKRRTDRKENIENIFKNINFSDYTFYESIDALSLKLNLEIKYLFKDNDFGNRKSFIGCALTHYNIWIDLIKDISSNYYLIFEDDFYICNNFIKKLDDVKKNLESDMNNIDILFLGYHSREKNDDFDKEDDIIFKYYDSNKYVGGFFSYIITKNGALKMLDYIKKNGIKHGIDYIIKLNSSLTIKECVPHIVFSNWVRNGHENVDSDIQKNYEGYDFNEIVDYNNYIFKPKVDNMNNDIKYFSKFKITELINESNKIDYCEGFNTLGFLKNKININELQESPWFRESDGIFIKIDRKINVKLMCNWQLSEELCNEWNNMSKDNFTWNDIKITSEDHNIDYYVIINSPVLGTIEYDKNNVLIYKEIFTQEYNSKKTIIFQMEPMCNNEYQKWGVKTWGDWAYPDENEFLEVRSHKNNYNNCSWQIKKTYNELMNEEIIKYHNNTLSSICSSKYFDPGHILRVEFLKFLEKKQIENIFNFSIDIYGVDNPHNFINYKKALSIEEKHTGLYPYKYYFIAENNKEHNYITEKFWEPLLSECLCFYWGADNLSEYINPLAYVALDLYDFEKSYQIIKNAIENDLYNERIKYIKEEKYKILNYYNFYPTIERIITKDLFKDKIEKFKIKIIIINSITDINDNNFKLYPFIKTLMDIGLNVEYFNNFTSDKLIVENIELIKNDLMDAEFFIKKLIYDNNEIKYLKKNIKNTINFNKICNSWNHIKNYEILVKDDCYESYLILEDNVDLQCSFKKLLNHILYLPDTYDICHIGNYDKINSISNLNKTKIIEQINPYYYIAKKYPFNDASAYFISKNGANKILNYINNYILFDSGELLYNSYENINNFNLYSTKDYLFNN